jgi:hypothetical protein
LAQGKGLWKMDGHQPQPQPHPQSLPQPLLQPQPLLL